MSLKVKRISTNAKLPTKAYEGDLGYDLYATETCIIPPKSRAKVKTGIVIEFPSGYGGFIKDRSSMANKGLHVGAGVIDNGYRGEIIVLLFNFNDTEYVVRPGDKIAQLVLIPTTNFEIIEVDEVSDAERGQKGFGSSGR